MRTSHALSGVSLIALLLSGTPALAQNTTIADVNVLNLLSPFLNLNAAAVGQSTLAANLNNAVAVNNFAGAHPGVAAVAISDKTIFGGPSTAITLINGTSASYGPGANLAGPMRAQAIQNATTTSGTTIPGTISAVQPIGGLGQLGPAFLDAVKPNGATAPNVVSFLTNAYNFISTDLGVAKNYFANGTTNGTLTAVAPNGVTLPTVNGYPNKTTSVYDTAYGVSNTGPDQNVYGNSRPVQVVPARINGFDPSALTGLNSNPSFPSGHTTYGYVDSILIGMMAPQFYQSMVLRGSEYGYSRNGLGVHYPLDIIASRALSSYDLSKLLNATDPAYLQTNAATGAAPQNLNTQFQAAAAQLTATLKTAAAATSCGTVANCAATNPYNQYSADTYRNAPSVTNPGTTTESTNSAIFQARLTYGLPTLSFNDAPRESAPASTGDASILLATLYGGSTPAAKALAGSVGGPLYGDLSTGTINQIIVNTETNAIAAFYGTTLSYWTRINLYDAAGYFRNVTGTIALDSNDKLWTNVTVANTGVLAGAGSIAGNVTIADGGALAPGAAGAPATTKIAGNLTFQSGAQYGVEVNSTTASATNVTGSAKLDGSAKVTSATNDYKFKQAYTILSAGNVNGTFNSLATPVGIVGALSYSAHDVQLTLTSGLGQIGGLSANQRAVGAGIDRAFNAGNASSAGGFNTIFNGDVAKNLLQASGEVATGSHATTVDAMGQFIGVMTDRAIAGRADETSSPVLSYAEGSRASKAAEIYNKAPLRSPNIDPQWSVWVAGFGGSRSTDGSIGQGSSSNSGSIYGTAIGADYLIGPNTIAGFALAGGGTNFSVANSGTGRSDLFQAGAYVLHKEGQAYVSAALAYGWQDITTDRTVAISGADRLSANFDANAFSGRIESGYRVASPFAGIGITPYAAAQFTTFSVSGYAEQGASSFALSYGNQNATDSRTELGLRTDKSFLVQNGLLTLRTRFAWAHDFNPNRSVAATFVTLPGAGFTVGGAAQASDSALASAAIELKFNNGWSAGATFDGEFSNVSSRYAGKGVVRYSW
ncbi:extracellular serine protease precursor [Variibacter gotjawalensis]|uniref:Extracellular serine protease n=1 Tax=Variibacter gotjawalensis TaxID=1333996 RepID=A0A0S3PQM2_9BRAD|nr:autotransporter domain-containing protein [Variibacter gotjawalensis]NIK48488.1 uncharacterized protein with beta-barrel porin domain [Variibacter gotjawalensis]RZS50355.1 uncharacterized protein with beta-barrel porin domain [Variibacter gotjawalensis]BAT58188.1 extracellular serine protease precursor [Variibacter gotjawalensis]